MTSTVYPRPDLLATQKQIRFIRTLLIERDPSIETLDVVAAAREIGVEAGALPKTIASHVIDLLLDSPRKPSITVGQAVAQMRAKKIEAGVYQEGSRIVRVYLGQKSGTMLAKEILFSADGPAGIAPGDVSYAYLGAAARVLGSDARRLSVSEVGALGKSWDHCLMCGRRLDDPESVDRGIGPVCAAKY